jgi:hypothetical protein
LVLQAMATNDAAVAKRNIHFFIDAGLLQDSDCRIRDAIDRDQPVLPSLSGTAPPTPQGLHSPPEIATLYNFPNGFDGRGVMVGIIEFGGNIVVSDLKPYFESLKLPPPEVTSVFIDGGSLEKDASLDTQVMLDIEIIGAIAPRAGIRVYFAPFTSSSLVHAIDRSATNHGGGAGRKRRGGRRTQACRLPGVEPMGSFGRRHQPEIQRRPHHIRNRLETPLGLAGGDRRRRE